METAINRLMTWGAYGFAILSILTFLAYELRLLFIRDYKAKYDFVNLREIRNFRFVMASMVVAVALYSNALLTGIFPAEGMIAIYVRVLYTAGFIVIAIFSLSTIIKVVYPKVIERRLVRIRNKPRVSPDGNKMRKLSEEEEDVHLEASQIEEEASEVHSVDYDVWVDEKTGYKRVEKYMNYLHAEACSECGYYTMKIRDEEITRQPSQDSPGLLIKHYQCSYCKHREAREAVIAKLASNVA